MRVQSKKYLDSGIDINTQNEEENTALHYASNPVSFEVSEELLKRGIDINLINSSGHSALHAAITGKNAELVDLYLSKGAKTLGFEGDDYLLTYALEEFASMQIIKSLVQSQKNEDRSLYNKEASENSFRVLVEARMDFSQSLFEPKENVQLIEFFLENGFDVNAIDTDSHENILFRAVKDNQLNIAKLLIKHKIDIHHLNGSLQTALDFATDNAEMVTLLNQAGLDYGHKQAVERKIQTLSNLAKKEGLSIALKAYEKIEDNIGFNERLGYKAKLYESVDLNIQERYNFYLLTSKLFNYSKISDDDYMIFMAKNVPILLQRLEEHSDGNNNKQWVRGDFSTQVDRYLDGQRENEDILNDLLQVSISIGEGMSEEDTNNKKELFYIHVANNLSLYLFDALIKIKREFYLKQKIRFLITAKSHWMDEHFEMFLELLTLEPDDIVEVQALLQKTFQYRHKLESDNPIHPICPVPDVFEEISAFYESKKEPKSQANALWYFKHILEKGFTSEDVGDKYIELSKRISSNKDTFEVIKLVMLKTPYRLRAKYAEVYVSYAIQKKEQDKQFEWIVRDSRNIEVYKHVLMPLIRAGANVDRMDWSTNSFLSRIFPFLSIDEFKYVLKSNDLNLDFVEADSDLSLFFMIANGLITNLEENLPYLLAMKDAGANVNTLHVDSGQTCLHVSARNGNYEVVKVLIEKLEVDPSIKDKRGKTALDYANENGNEKLTSYLSNLQ